MRFTSKESILAQPIFPQVFLRRLSEKPLIPFIGAGVSKLAGCPDWNEFADNVLRFFIDEKILDYSKIEQHKTLSPFVKLQFARSLENEHKCKVDYKKILKGTSGTEIYKILNKLSLSFVTTNYDTLLDELQLLPEENYSESNQTSSEIQGKRNSLFEKQHFLEAHLKNPTVIHLHGSVNDSSSMILTVSDYLNHYANDREKSKDSDKENRVLTFLTDLFNKNTLLFIGYGLEELQILEYILLKKIAK